MARSLSVGQAAGQEPASAAQALPHRLCRHTTEPLGVGVVYAIWPSEHRLALMRPLSLAHSAAMDFERS